LKTIRVGIRYPSIFDHCASAPLWEEFFEAHGYGPNAEDDPAAVINAMIEVVRFGGGTGIPGIYTAGDTQARNRAEKQGRLFGHR